MLDNFEEIKEILDKTHLSFGMDYGSYNLVILKNEDGEVVRYYIITEPDDLELLSDEIKYVCKLYGLTAEIDIRFRTFANSKTSIYKKLYGDVKHQGDGYKSKHQRENIEDCIITSLLNCNTVKWQKVNIVKVSSGVCSKLEELLEYKKYLLLGKVQVKNLFYYIVDNTNKRTFRDIFSEYGEVLTECFIPLYSVE